METLLAVVVVTLFPLAVVLAPLLLAGWVERRRAAVIARQVELTEAIHRDLGAVVAPFVTRRPGGRWRVRIAVPFERPAVVEAVLAVVHRTFRERFDLVLTPQEVGVVGVNEYALEYLVRERLAEIHRDAEAQRLAAARAGAGRAALAARVRLWLSAVRRSRRPAPLTDTRAAR